MQCKELESVLEQEGLTPLPAAARAHLAGCSSCQNLLADLTSIVSAAHGLPAEVEPPARVWISLHARLEQEGIIKKPVLAPAAQRSSWWLGFQDLVRSRALATVTVGLLLVVAGVFQLRGPDNPPSSPALPNEVVKIVNQQEADLRNMHLTSTSPVDASFQENLQQINEFIADCDRHLKQAPQDELAREYLAEAYQQKAELLSAMMDRGRSIN
jgi:hypothetical protein